MAQNYDNLVIKRTTTTETEEQPVAAGSAESQPLFTQRQPVTPVKKKMSPWLWAIPVVLFAASAALSYAVFFKPAELVVVENPVEPTEEGSLLNASGPKTEACPLNGQLYTVAEREAWEQRRPLAIMVENTPDARPQSGLNNADIIYEAVAEGGITRFMPIFYCGAQAEDVVVAPVRSARTYYINLASGYNYPLYVHVGGANVAGPTNALGQLGDYGWEGENDINQFSVGYPTFVRNYNRIPGKNVATEHTMETTTEGLWKVAEKRGWTNMSPDLTVGKKTVPASDWKAGYKGWTFVDGKANSAPTASTISYDFWTGYPTYAVQWRYDAATNSYTRYQNGGAEVQTDMNTGEPISVNNVVLMFAKEEGPINEKQHMMYHVIGTGKATIFKNGEAIEATWTKKDREAELEFADSKGNPIEFSRGKVWVSVVDTANKATYQ